MLPNDEKPPCTPPGFLQGSVRSNYKTKAWQRPHWKFTTRSVVKNRSNYIEVAQDLLRQLDGSKPCAAQSVVDSLFKNLQNSEGFLKQPVT